MIIEAVFSIFWGCFGDTEGSCYNAFYCMPL